MKTLVIAVPAARVLRVLVRIGIFPLGWVVVLEGVRESEGKNGGGQVGLLIGKLGM